MDIKECHTLDEARKEIDQLPFLLICSKINWDFASATFWFDAVSGVSNYIFENLFLKIYTSTLGATLAYELVLKAELA